MRCLEPGWVELACPDGRRGVWMRVTDTAIEICAGREGDDELLRLVLGETVTGRTIYDAQSILDSFEYAKEVAGEK